MRMAQVAPGGPVSAVVTRSLNHKSWRRRTGWVLLTRRLFGGVSLCCWRNTCAEECVGAAWGLCRKAFVLWSLYSVTGEALLTGREHRCSLVREVELQPFSWSLEQRACTTNEHQTTICGGTVSSTAAAAADGTCQSVMHWFLGI